MRKKLSIKNELLTLNHQKESLNAAEIIKGLITNEVIELAKLIDIRPVELQSWVDLQCSNPRSLSSNNILHLLRTAKQFRLDPLQNEVLLTQYEEEWQVSIGVDGWIKLINRHPAFQGITFAESPQTFEDLPIWMECTIYRSDRTIPISTREYLSEVMVDSDIWKKMPRRMLRHRALQQCARLAFAINPPEGRLEKQIPESAQSNKLNLRQKSQNKQQTKPLTSLGGVDGLKMNLMGQANLS